jgi:hypothetical protein
VTNEQLHARPKGRELFDAIRQRPALYLGTQSLTGLYHFMSGYDHALSVHSVASMPRLMPPLEFHDWVAYRLHFSESTSGWHRMILKSVSDEPVALKRFYKLFDEFESREPRIVAKLTGYRNPYFSKSSDGTEVACSYPSPILFIVYTDDPGFFVTAENPQARFPGAGFCPHLERLSLFSFDLTDLEIIDQGRFDRWKTKA